MKLRSCNSQTLEPNSISKTLFVLHLTAYLAHSGHAHTLSSARKNFWITKANAAVRKVILLNAASVDATNDVALEQKMADLPEVRI